MYDSLELNTENASWTPKEIPPNSFNREIEENPELKHELAEGLHRKTLELEKRGVKIDALILFGSMRWRDSKIRRNPQNPEEIDSDVDLFCFSDNPGPFYTLMKALKGEARFLRQKEVGIKAEKPFSKHIEYFQIEIFSTADIVKLLDEDIAELKKIAQKVDLEIQSEMLRTLNPKLVIYRALKDGLRFYGSINEKIQKVFLELDQVYNEVMAKFDEPDNRKKIKK